MHSPTLDFDALIGLLHDGSLARIEAIDKRFNFFEAVGMTSQEIRHSAFLSFLLDPEKSHGFHSSFLRAFLSRCSVPDGHVLTLQTVRIRREWNNIDLLVECADDRLVIVIENKVWTGEHSDQLARYLETAKVHYPGWRIVGIYLTPGAAPASDSRYCSISYRALVEEIERLLSETPDLEPDADLVCRHYVQMVRTHIVGGSEVEALCQAIYQKHRHAIDLIVRHRPNTWKDTHQFLRDLADTLVCETDSLIIDQSKPEKKEWVSFLPASWLPLLPHSQGDPWSLTGKLLFFVFHNFDGGKSFRIELELRPGLPRDRERLFAIAKSDQSGVVQIPRLGVGTKYVKFYTRTLLAPKDCESATPEALETLVRAGWNEFLTHDLPRLETLFHDALSAPATTPTAFA